MRRISWKWFTRSLLLLAQSCFVNPVAARGGRGGKSSNSGGGAGGFGRGMISYVPAGFRGLSPISASDQCSTNAVICIGCSVLVAIAYCCKRTKNLNFDPTSCYKERQDVEKGLLDPVEPKPAVESVVESH